MKFQDFLNRSTINEESTDLDSIRSELNTANLDPVTIDTIINRRDEMVKLLESDVLKSGMPATEKADVYKLGYGIIEYCNIAIKELSEFKDTMTKLMNLVKEL